MLHQFTGIMTTKRGMQLKQFKITVLINVIKNASTEYYCTNKIKPLHSGE